MDQRCARTSMPTLYMSVRATSHWLVFEKCRTVEVIEGADFVVERCDQDDVTLVS
jgi:hypothetical protein